jgi:hypothetical protein
VEILAFEDPAVVRVRVLTLLAKVVLGPAHELLTACFLGSFAREPVID